MDGRFVIQGVFAEGAQARLYSAQDLISSQTCILKAGESAKEEALLALEFNHPYVVQPFDCGVYPEIGPYAAYPKIDHPSLLEWIRTKPTDEELRRVAVQIAEFVCFLHHRGYLYNDFKPEHFLISDQEIRVVDLGLCAPVRERTMVFSGTFPYISPERMMGRRHDQRSDVFAFGILLLHCFYPKEEWNLEPSLPALQQLLNKCSGLDDYWAKLITQMTSLEPSQRFESAEEVWRRLLPSCASGNFLYFPLAVHRNGSSGDLFGEAHTLLVKSPSRIDLGGYENYALYSAWKQDWQTFYFDLQSRPVEDYFSELHKVLLGEAPTDFFSCIQKLQTIKSERKILILFHMHDRLSSQVRSQAAFAISSLSNVDTFRVVTTFSGSGVQLDAEGCRKIELPLIDKQSNKDVLRSVLSLDREAEQKAEKLKSRQFSTPEQLFGFLRKELPSDGFAYWPAAARTYTLPPVIERLTTRQMRLLGFIAIAGGSLRISRLVRVVGGSREQVEEFLNELEIQGYVHRSDDEVHLTPSPETVLGRLRQARIKDLAVSLLESWPDKEDLQTKYRIARFARNQRVAAAVALNIARANRQENKKEAAMQWYWNAFSQGARLQKSILFGLLKFTLRHMQISHSRKLFSAIRKRFGLSYRLAELQVEYDQRTSNLAKAEEVCKKVSEHAVRKKHHKAQQYFTVRMAGFMVLQFEIEKGKKILSELMRQQLGPRLTGLTCHFMGLADLLSGQITEALQAFKEAVRLPHAQRANSAMSLGLTLSRLGKSKGGQRWLRRAIRIFMIQQDVDRLSYAYGNLGIILIQNRDVIAARENFLLAMQLSRITRNQFILISGMINLSTTFEYEGRTNYALRYCKKAVLVAQKHGLKKLQGQALSNAGLQYAIQGRFVKAITALREAISILNRLQLTIELAEAHEHLGLCYFFSGQDTRSDSQFSSAEKLYREAGTQLHVFRMQICRALALKERGQLEKMKQLLDSMKSLEDESFTAGLYNYALASWGLATESIEKANCRQALQEAERIFRDLPSLFWLGRMYQLKAEYLRKTDHYEKANVALQSAYNIFSRLGARKELLRMSKQSSEIGTSKDLLERMAEKLPYKVLLMVREVLAEQNPDVMISKILSASIEFTDMERAVLILTEDPPRIYKSVTLEEDIVQEIYDISKTAMETASSSGKPYVSLDALADPHLKGKRSILASRIMSIVCLPLRAQDKLLGVLYLDSREGVETLASTESVLLEIFASVIGLALNKTLILERSIAENEELRASLGMRQFPEIIGTSEPMTKVLRSVNQLLNTNLPVLITGETGVGKELIARVLHFCGSNKNGSFVAINCSAVSKSLLESELFGHEKGAFTSADAQKKGLVEQAKNGTLFLDEIGEMPYSMQAKLLRFMQEGEFRRVGGNETLHSNARIVLATNRNLKDLVQREQFREDLYYRIKGAEIHLPPLRERKEDIPLLIAHFIKSSTIAERKKVKGFAPEAIEVMRNFSWPGNVRQLRNEIERAIAFTETEWVRSDELEQEIRETPIRQEVKSLTLKEREKEIILEALTSTKWNIVHTARILGLTRNGLYGKMKTHGIPRKQESL